MSEQTTGENQNPAGSWEPYWKGTGDAGAYGVGGVGHPAIAAFWDEFFSSAVARGVPLKMVDLATGNGAVVERALAVLSDEAIAVHCVDASPAAIENIGTRFPIVEGQVADVCSVPEPDGAFNIVTSQFGLEYAGQEAFGEAARLVAEGGVLAILAHHEGSRIHAECSAALDALCRMEEARFVPLASTFFEAGFAALNGADRGPYDEAGRRLAPAIAALEDIMRTHGEQVAGETVVRLYQDVGRIHSRIAKYDSREVLDWLVRLQGELSAYAARMKAMVDAAVDPDGFDSVCQSLIERGFGLRESGPFYAPGDDVPMAWALIATR
jgi:SAM-dependent methyltransferase